MTLPMMAQVEEKITDVTKYVTESNVEKLVDKYSDKLEAAITSLAETLQQPAEFVYGVLIKQQYVKAYASIIPWIIFLCLLPVFISLMKRGLVIGRDDRLGGEHNYFYFDDSHLTITIIIGIFLGASLITGAVCLQFIIQGFINPDYGAMQDIVNMIK